MQMHPLIIEKNRQNRRCRDLVRKFVLAVSSGDNSGMRGLWTDITSERLSRDAMLAVSRLQEVPCGSRKVFMEWWKDDNLTIYEGLPSSHTTMIRVLRRLLPKYTGSPLRLYRGDSFRNHSRQTYGASWTTDRETAEAFATGALQTSADGSVLLVADAPAFAIVCALSEQVDDLEAGEFIVDRRRLKRVRVLEWYPQRGFSSLAFRK
jgi:hypothetical protein